MKIFIIFYGVSKNIVGIRVKRARRMAKPLITQENLVARLETMRVKTDRTIVSKIENGKRPVHDYEVVALAKALKVSVCWLLGIAKDK